MLQSPTALPEKISGYDLANHLLSQGGVEALIRYAGNAETDWLELKAGMCLLPEDRKKGETEKDLYWNIAKEVIALMNTSGGALVIGVHDKTLNLVPLEDNDPRHVLVTKGIDGYVREFVRSNVWPSSLSWNYRGKIWELADKQVSTDLISYHHAPYSGPDGRIGEVVVLLVKPCEKIRLAKEDRKSSVLLKRTRGEVGEAIAIYDYDEFEKYRVSREIESAFYANVRDQFDREHAAASESAKLAVAIKDYYNGLVEKSRRMRAVFTSLDAEENVFSKADVDQFYSPEAIETFDDEDRWLDDDEENEERERNNQEEDDDSNFEEDSDEDSLDNDDDAEDRYDERTARKGDLLELLKLEHRVIVSGEPGGGKTTCLTYFTLKFAEGESEDPVLAVFIPMGQWRRGGSLSLMVEKVTGLDTSQIARLMEENRLRLVIDAVNECPDEFRVAAIQNIGMFLAEHPNIPAVISTRHPKELSSLQLPVFHVQPMDETHRLHYLERYLADGKQAQKLLHQLGSMPGGETVAENPMLLRLVVEVYKESPEKRLPNGRAGLYRRSLRAWYKRENEKAEKAGTKLQWNRRQTFELLAVLAFKSRQLGYRDVPLEEITAIWGDDAENQLEVLCQGPIIYCDDEFVRFRHETFQEYLCAEYLVAHQDELPAWTQDDYAQWGMPFAYVVELFELDKQQLPETFWRAAWSLNPWLGVALTDESKGRQLLSPHYQGKRPMVDGRPLDIHLKAVYLRAVCGTLNTWGLRNALGDELYPWYTREDVALRYVVFVSPACQIRWERFEDRQLLCLKGLWVTQAVKLSRSWLMLDGPRDIFQYHAPEDWDGWIANARPKIAIALVDSHLAVPSDFSDVKAQWVANENEKKCCALVKANILQPIDLRERIPQWVATATPETASYMIESGVVPRSEFDEQIHKWCESATLPLATAMIKSGLAHRMDFAKNIPRWIEAATPTMACTMIESGMACLGDFKKKLPFWLDHPQYQFVRSFLRRNGNDVTSEICIDRTRVRRWIELADLNSAFSLIQDGLAVAKDFSEKIVLWADFKRIRRLQAMVAGGMMSQDVAELRVAVDNEVQLAITTHRMPSTDEQHRWLSYCNFKALVEIVKAGLIVREDAVERVNYWKLNATPQVACSLVSSNLAQAGDFSPRVEKWKNSLSPDDALSLIKCGVIGQDDVAKLKEGWRKCVTPTTLRSVVELGCLSVEEVKEYLSLWEDNVPEKAGKGLKELIGHFMWKRIVTVWERLKDADRAMVVHGKVKNITDFGAFIDLDGIYGLLHITDMSWGRIKHPSELLKVGQEINVKVLDVDRDKERISLGLKQMTENPWNTIAEKFPVGSRVRGKVMNLAAYGAFVEIAPGIEGLVHISEFSWTKRVARPSDMLSIGDEITVQVLSVAVENQKIALGIRQMQENPWDTVQDRYPVGSRVKGKVCKFTNLCAFIELKEGIDGMICLSDMSWTRMINRPSECLNLGDEVEAIVLGVDPEKCQIELGLKQAQQNPWPEIMRKYALGMVVTGHVTKLASFGAFVELEPGVDCLIHVSEISNKPITKVKDVLSVGEEVTARVIKLDREACRIALSIKALSMTEEELKTLKDNNGGVTQESKAGTLVSGTSSQVSTDTDADTSEGDLRS